MKRLLTFDENGFYIDEEIVQDGLEPGTNQYLAELNEDITFHRPKLVDGKVVEGKTEDEFLEEELMNSLLPTKEETEKAEFEIKVLTLLSEMEMF